MSRWKEACACAISNGIPRRALIVALLVGTVLNLINQGDLFLERDGAVNWLKILLTYLVPYAVSTHGAIASRFGAMGMPSNH
ncbi:MAG: nitrate/nitrite transporter NrtS [Nitrospiraceae bacterium]